MSSGETGGGLRSPVTFPPDHEPEVFPDYPHRHQGPALVVGSAWTMADDVQAAKEKYPHAFVIGLNRTGRHVKCDAMVSIDRGLIEGWKADHEAAFGPLPYGYHSGQPGGTRRREEFPAVDYWWPNFQRGGTSAWLAAKIALAMGLSPIILCGVPMASGPYTDGEQGPSWQNENHIRVCREAMRRDGWMKDHVRSMSGWTGEYFGAP